MAIMINKNIKVSPTAGEGTANAMSVSLELNQSSISNYIKGLFAFGQ